MGWNLTAVDTGRLVDDRCLRSPQRVGSIILARQANSRDPFINQASILSGAYVLCVIGAAWKGKLIQRTAAKFEPLEQAGASIVHQFKLNWSTGLLLNDGRPCPDFAITNNVTDPDFHKVATLQLAIDSEIKKRSISNPSVLIKE